MAGEWVSIASSNAPSSNVFDFPSLSLGSYKRIRIWLLEITVSASDTEVAIQAYIGGVLQTTTIYSWVLQAESSSDTNQPDSATGANHGPTSGNNANWSTGIGATKSYGGYIDIVNPGVAGVNKRYSFHTSACPGDTTNQIFSSGAGMIAASGAWDGIKVIGNGGNLLAGKVRIWGMT